MVQEINSITVVPSFVSVGAGLRPVLTVIGDETDAKNMREWFDRARSSPVVHFLFTGGETAVPEKPFRPEIKVKCRYEGCNEMTPVGTDYCSLHREAS